MLVGGRGKGDGRGGRREEGGDRRIRVEGRL